MKHNLRQCLPLIALLGLTLYLSGRVNAEIVTRDIPHAPDWDGTAPQFISNPGTSIVNVADRPFIDASPNGNKLIIVYNRKMSAGNDKDPYFSRSTSGGQSWSFPAPIYTSIGEATNSLEVNLVIDAQGIGHAVWVEANNKILYSKETNWPNDPAPTEIYSADIQASSPQIVASGTNILDIIWTATDITGTGLARVWHKRSTNGGASWSNGSPVSPSNVEALFTDIAIDNNGNLHVVWEQTDSAHPQVGAFIYYSRGTVTGTSISWSNAVRIGDVSEDPDGNGPIEENSRSARRMAILAANGRLHVTFTTHWKDDSQWVHYVTCNNSCQNGQNWSDDVPISGEVVGVNANSPKYIVSDIFKARGCIYTYFHGIDDTLENNELILGTNSCDSWSSFGRDQVTQPQNQSLHTSSVATQEFIHMVYEQTGDEGATRQIYYRRGLPPPYSLHLPFIAKK